MDHALQTISYIADINDIIVIMARQGLVASPTASGGSSDSNGNDGSLQRRRQVKICCHIFESDEVRS